METQSPLVRWMLIVAVVALAAIATCTLHLLPHRSRISDAQLCSQATAFAKRMRDFEHERWAQHDRSIDQFRAMMGKAKTKEEQERIRKQSNDELNSFLSTYASDFDNRFRTEAKRLRSELLKRLPSREQSKLRAGEVFFDGPLVGAYPVFRLASLLDDLAKKICPSSHS